MIQQTKLCEGCKIQKPIWKRIDGKPYCKYCSYIQVKPKSISKVSDKQKIKNSLYTEKRREYFSIDSNTFCKARFTGCTIQSTDIHHSKGRDGDNLLDTSTWLPVCRSCHTRIENNPEEAKLLNFSQSRL